MESWILANRRLSFVVDVCVWQKMSALLQSVNEMSPVTVTVTRSESFALLLFLEDRGRIPAFEANFLSVHTHTFNGNFSETTRVSRYQKGKTNLDFIEARYNEWQWHISAEPLCKSAPRCRRITTPAPHHLVFTGRMPFLPPNRQCQNTVHVDK